MLKLIKMMNLITNHISHHSLTRARARARAREKVAQKRDVFSLRTSQKHEFELTDEAQIENFGYFLDLTVSTGRSFKANR